jgi:hypothetical protein
MIYHVILDVAYPVNEANEWNESMEYTPGGAN